MNFYGRHSMSAKYLDYLHRLLLYIVLLPLKFSILMFNVLLKTLLKYRFHPLGPPYPTPSPTLLAPNPLPLSATPSPNNFAPPAKSKSAIKNS